MNISSINSYNYTSFTAGKKGKYSKPQATKPQISDSTKKAGAIGLAGVVALGGGGFLIKGCQSDSATLETTQPTSAYIETMDTIPSETYFEIEDETDSQANAIESVTISAIPQNERAKEKYHTVKQGDTLTNIVIEYAELDKNYPYEKLIPYIEILRTENPTLIKKQDRYTNDGKTLGLPEYVLLYIEGKPLRVDGIFPENIITTTGVTTQEEIPETEAPEIEETQPRVISPEDTIVLNGIEYNFDLGTMDSSFGDYEGLVEGKFVTLDKKLIGGNLIETRYAGTNSKSNIEEVITYDKNGKITERLVYDENNSVMQKHTYEYTMDVKIETVKNLNSQSGHINAEKITYELGDDFVISKEFFVGNTSVATFNFDNDTVKIGDNEPWVLDEGTFIYNSSAIGPKKYYGTINGQTVRFDVLKNGFCAEYVDAYGDIEARMQYDAKGNLICME